jgi:hypothetical protein
MITAKSWTITSDGRGGDEGDEPPVGENNCGNEEVGVVWFIKHNRKTT